MSGDCETIAAIFMAAIHQQDEHLRIAHSSTTAHLSHQVDEVERVVDQHLLRISQSNLRMAELASAIATAQFKKLDDEQEGE